MMFTVGQGAITLGVDNPNCKDPVVSFRFLLLKVLL
jgi:hypothetical protein